MILGIFMAWHFVPYTLFSLCTAIIALLVAVIAFSRLELLGVWAFAGAMLGVAIWSFATAAESAVVDQATKILWSQIDYLGYCTVVPLIFLFGLEYTGHKRLDRRQMALLWLIPVITILLAWTNAWHGLVWSGFSPGDSSLNILIYHRGLWWWVPVAYYYLLTVMLMVILVRSYFHTAVHYRQQIRAVILGCIFPPVSGLIYAFNLSPWPGMDVSVAGFILSGFIFTWSIFRLGLLDQMPVARETLIEQLGDGVIVLDNQNRVVDINPAAKKLFQSPPDSLIGQPALALLAQQLGLDLSNLGEAESSLELKLPGEEIRYLEMYISFLHNHSAKISGRLILLRDITARKKVEFELQHAYQTLQSQLNEIQNLQSRLQEQAIRDSLTSLFNRRYLMEMLDRELARATRDRIPVSLVMIDIDHFKQVNDQYGHKAGDLVLQALSILFSSKIRRMDIACRYGGDEFFVVLPGASLDCACKRADEWRSEFEKLHINYGDQLVGATFSAGAAEFPVHGETVEEILSAVDRALYAAKTAGRNCVRTA